MISRIQSIYNIGNYLDYLASGDVSLKKFNIFYAENGAGKTTLATILRSLALGEGILIDRHKRLNAISSPKVEIKLEDNSLCRYDNGKWNHCCPV